MISEELLRLEQKIYALLDEELAKSFGSEGQSRE